MAGKSSPAVMTTALTAVPDPAARGLILQNPRQCWRTHRSLRGHGTTGMFGPQGPGIVQDLAFGFSDATRITLVICGLFLAIGAAASLRVALISRNSRTPHRRPTPPTSPPPPGTMGRAGNRRGPINPFLRGSEPKTHVPHHGDEIRNRKTWIQDESS